MRNLTKYNEDLSIPRKKDVEERSTATNLENGAGAGALKQAGAAAASGANATAFGSGTSASAASAHAEGNGAVASGSASHAQNSGTKASGDYSHAEGSTTEASGQAAHAEGTGTVAANRSQHVEGEFNVQDPSGNEPSGRGTYQHIVGNGTSDTNRSNAHTMDWNGNAWYAGDVYVGSTSGTGMDNGSKKLATEDFVTADYLQKTGDSSETTATFEQAAARENVASGDKLSALFGKIAKWFSDLKTVAFSGKSSDLDNDAKFQTESDLNTALAAKQDNLISSGASVGNLVKVKAVDANGKPTAWEIAEAGTDYAPAVMFVEVTGSSGDYETIVYTQQIWMVGRFKRSVFMYSDEDSMFYPLIASTQEQACFGGLDAYGNAVRYIVNSDRTVEKHLTPIGGKTYPVILTVAGWNASTKQQAVSFAAASSTETDHLLIPTPKLSDLTAYNDAGVLCIGEDGTAQTLTFQCETVPTAEITVYVTVQSVNYQGDAS